MRVLIAGGTGQVGSDLAKVLTEGYEVVALGKADLDVSRESSIDGVLEEIRPAYLVNAAAFTQVDACESQREMAWRANAEAPGFLGWACRERGIPILHLSTDYVFDGRKPPTEAYTEEDPTNPISFYGESKLEGEKQLMASGAEALILRTSWVYGIEGRNFLKAILKRALAGQALKVVNDQWGAPTWSHRLALQIRRLIAEDVGGLCHSAAEGATTWYEVAREFFRLMEIPVSLAPCETSEYPTAARRPANSRLENRRLKALGLNEMKDWREDLTEFVGLYRERLIEEARAS